MDTTFDFCFEELNLFCSRCDLVHLGMEGASLATAG